MRVTPEIPTLRSPTAKAARDTPGVLPGGPNPERLFGGINGRRERIRTSGPYVPNVVLYQAELLSDAGRPKAGLRGSALIAMPLGRRNQPKAQAFPGIRGVPFGIFAALKARHPLYMVPA